MKATIHPEWFAEALISCACGNTFKTGATKAEIRVEICSRCHPFFTGEARFADAEGKIIKFQKQMEKAKVSAPALAKKKAKKLNLPTDDSGPKSLKEMLMGA